MIIDVTGVELTPGNGGNDCMGNGEHISKNGVTIECCCDECDYMMCCFCMEDLSECSKCPDKKCPHSIYNSL